ncbi:helix-turn-helix transcriptional regulator [Bifidobacterium platyrrhinorum]|uniref:WYL domain-containing protein n=1 Tax=Bifidobacterium platyrrhinorum TaxID=2661628 RepID=A0A6L9SP71_9BIFI|nr:WYL domain-containing transcriptional regulator [Bifidobacterium platyrrhinorum]NEG54310.1 WYL domain-containing protein [Bifidobacterium platyrrhinorum]
MARTKGRETPASSTAQIVVEILELLDSRTDREHGLSAAEIAEALDVNEKTVRGHLRTLGSMSPFGRRVRRIGRADLAHAESADPRPGWTIDPILDTAQMRLLTDGAMLSRSDGDYLRDLVAKVHAFAGRADRPYGPGRMSTPRNHNTEFLNTIELLDDAIAHERAITFRYCTYDIDGELVPRRDADGTAREYHADPYHLMYKNNMYYLVCHMHPYDDLSYLHVERLRDLTMSDADHTLERSLDSFSAVPGTPFDVVAHMNERPYPVTGEAVPIRMRITGSLEPLYDWFDDASVTRTGESEYEVRVVANERATLWWALQYADGRGIEILEPSSLRERLRLTGEHLAREYGGTAGTDLPSR